MFQPLPARFILLAIGMWLLIIAPTIAGQDAEPPTEEPSSIQRIAAVGASATAGFGIVTPRNTVMGRMPGGWSLAKSIRTATGDTVVVSDLGTGFFFMAPHSTGQKLMDRALKSKPDLLVAVDFLFWFAYGTQGPNQAQMRTPEERMEMLDVGLALLDAYDGPIIVGDLPDMSGAIGKMLGRRQYPGRKTLDTLNARIHAWADARPRVRVFPLNRFMEELRAGDSIEIGPHQWTAEEAGKILQRDELHPTLSGQVALVQILDAMLDEHPATAGNRPEMTVDRDTLLNRINEKNGVATPKNPPKERPDDAAGESRQSSLGSPRKQITQRLAG